MSEDMYISSAFWPAKHAAGLTFSLSKKEAKKFSKWTKTLPDANSGAIGGRFAFSFTPTSVGIAVSVKDSVTGKEINVTDYESW